MIEGVEPIELGGVRKVLFVCLGNICRSPLAQGVLEHLARERDLLDDFTIESCGTGSWHVGHPPDPRTIEVARKHGIELTSRARMFDPATDPDRFDLILAMDRSNLATILRRGSPPERSRLFLSLLRGDDGKGPPDLLDVPDPYHGGSDGFDEVFGMVRRGCESLLQRAVG